MRQRAPIPVEVAEVRDTTADGKGVAVVDGKTVFIDGALRGEHVSFRRSRRRKNYDEALLVEIVRPATERVEPRCCYFGVCGGCSLQHLNSAAQLSLKQGTVMEALRRIGKLTPARELPPLQSKTFGYRRRGRLGAKYVTKKERVLVGFREKQKPFIADMQSCETLEPRLAQLIAPLSELIGSLSISGSVPQVEVSAGDTAVALVFRVLETPGEQDLQALRRFARRHRVGVWLQAGGPDTLSALPDTCPPELAYRLAEYDLTLRYGPLDFVQVNQDVNRLMLRQALDLLQPQPGQHVLDLFCGIGNFSLPVARAGAAVLGVEFSAEMVQRARQNAVFNGIEGTEFVAADLQQDPSTLPFLQRRFDAVLLDPPRAGAREVLAAISATGAQRIVYVSCHPGSLARDAGELVHEHGFTLQAAGAMDMFPQTGHVEAMALFERLKS
ncbi:MAG: 23S rRNA (uracil(1939)-C(5))-methyltransferase RlmD [Gammaproteobacteria bacterium]|jgi:23S rRNA (uracil1939-C5)-methyltransferase|nr:23S rRNA (uracil(1939)-C(5))-methyltransferase RlmD [Gammaproteobacteria bacterium]